MKYYRVHMKDCAYITKQPRGIFTAVGRLVSSKTLLKKRRRNTGATESISKGFCQFLLSMRRIILTVLSHGSRTVRKQRTSGIR